MSQETYLSFAAIVSQIQRLCDTGKTGVLFVTTSDNRSAQVMIENGTIVFVYFFNKRGVDALHSMLEIEVGKTRFKEGNIPPSRQADLGATPDILNFFRGKAGDTTASSEAVVSSSKEGALSEREKQLLEEVLTAYIGPMASIVCEDHLESAHDVYSAIEALASEIPSSAQADQFRKAASEKVASE